MVKISAHEKGPSEAPVLVCLHGYAGSVLHWEKISEELSALFRVVTPNLTHLYMGLEELSFTQQIEVVADYLRQQFPRQKVFISGISYGGAMAWGVALKHPELVEKLLLINPMPPAAQKYFARPRLKWFFVLPLPVSWIYLYLGTAFGQRFLSEAAAVFRNLQAQEGESRIEKLYGRKLKFIAQLLWKFSWILRKEDWHYWESQLTNWKHETLLIYDRKDPLFTSDFYDGFAKALVGTNVVTTVDAGHISIVQQPRLIAGAMREYLLRDFYQEVVGYN